MELSVSMSTISSSLLRRIGSKNAGSILAALIHVDPPTSFHNPVYLGCCQYAYNLHPEDLKLNTEFYNQTFGDYDAQLKLQSTLQ